MPRRFRSPWCRGDTSAGRSDTLQNKNKQELTVRLLKVVLAGVADVQDVCDLQGFDDASVGSVMPVAEIHPTWKDLVRIRVGHGPAGCYLDRITYGRGTQCSPAPFTQWYK